MTTDPDWLQCLAALRDTMPEEPDAAHEAHECPSAEKPAGAAAQSGRLDIVYERKGRAGKCATIVTGFTLPDDEVAAIASEMKRRLGTGGSARGGEILVQGDRRADVLAFLKSKGLKARII